MRDPLEARPGRRGAGVLRWVERLLLLAGVAMLGWVAVIVTDATIAQRVARQSLAIAPADTSRSPLEPARAEGGSPRSPSPIRGSALAELSIPRLHLSAVVLHGSDAHTLRRGPGHLENTALPGEPGNAVIAGHRDSFFRPLRNVQVGDDVFVDTRKGRFQYRVTSLRVVKPHDLSVLNPTDDAVLTLITCYPFWVLGDAPDRFVVRAVGVRDAASATFTAAATPSREATGAPPVTPLAEAASLASNTPVVPDDESLVRQALERFRRTHNARSISHDDARADGLLRFEACEVTFTTDGATAACDVPVPPSADGGPQVWTVALERAAGGWAIRSIAVEESAR
ncbi:MAG TPA: class D sortase [Vicinamibacterales bacterium]|nr:class D sortase [Vicinamibacterales bacterium]